MPELESYDSYLERQGLEQIELFGKGVKRVSKLYDRLISKVEIKQFLLRGPKELFEEFQELCEATDSSVTEGILELMRIALEESKEDPRIQKAIEAKRKEKKKAKKSTAKKSTTTRRKPTKPKENPEQQVESPQ